MQEILNKFKSQLEKTLDFFKNDIAVLRAGRPTPALVENILIDAYGQKMPLQQLAVISVNKSLG
ncbi:MAG: Ribosome-recycling factor [Candidatus Moranbacteria bacterium GW2011_GWF2_37_7]|nr:MAG: Ribosome-recycling factor [Candidatus Moranbacteria bacterium GW2011_GWF2_37_7]